MVAWSEGSVLITNRMVQLPRMATRYTSQMGIVIHKRTRSSPGIPIRKKVVISISEELRVCMMNQLEGIYSHI